MKTPPSMEPESSSSCSQEPYLKMYICKLCAYMRARVCMYICKFVVLISIHPYFVHAYMNVCIYEICMLCVCVHVLYICMHIFMCMFFVYLLCICVYLHA
jgi:hypothetical protein